MKHFLNNIYRVYSFLFAKNCLFKFNKFMYNLSIRGIGIYNYENMNVSGENNFINKYLTKYSGGKSKFIVFDVGAHIGKYSKLITKAINNAEVYSFEPHPITFKILKKNIESVKNVNLYNLALSSKEAILDIYDYQNNDGSSHASLNSEIFQTVHYSKITSHKVNVTTIDIFAENNKIEKIDFLKIDVEGFELEVLKGAFKLIYTGKIEAIQFEFTQLNSTVKVFFKDFYEMLSKDYNLYRLLPKSLHQIKEYDPTMTEIFGYQNYVAVLKSKKWNI